MKNGNYKKYDLFFSLFPESIFCYIAETKKAKELDLPTFHTRTFDATKEANGYASFISVNGFPSNAKRRTADSCTSLQHLYVDIDAPHDVTSTKHLTDYKNLALSRIKALDRLLPLSILVETKRGFHVYYRITPSSLTTNLNERPDAKLNKTLYLGLLKILRDYLEADHQSSDISRVLRVPFTLHRKDEASPFTIKLLTTRPSVSHTLEELKEILEPIRQEMQQEPENAKHEVQHEVQPNEPDIFVELEKLKPEKDKTESPESLRPLANAAFRKAVSPESSCVIPQEVKDTFFAESLEHLNKVFPIMERQSFMSVASPRGIPNGERNATLIIAASLMRRAGASEDQCLTNLIGYNGLKDREVKAVICSAYKRPEPFDFAWNHPTFSIHVSNAEKQKVKAIISDYCTNRLIEYIQAHREQIKTKKLKAATVANPVPDEVSFVESGAGDPPLTQKEQANILTHFPQLFLKEHPSLRFCRDGKFFLFQKEPTHAYSNLTPDDMERLVIRLIEDLGLKNYATITTTKSQVLRLSALSEIAIESRDINSNASLKKVFNSDGPFVPMKNGILDIKTDILHPYSKETIFTSPVATRFLPKEEVKPEHVQIVHEFMDDITQNNPERKEILQMVAGYTLLSDNRFQKSFFFLGSGANGKSTFQNLLAFMVGQENVLSFSFSELKNNFFLAGIMGKRLGIVEEISGHYFESDVFKRVTGETMITADRKHRESVSFIPQMKTVISMNQLPRVNDVSNGYYRRLVIVDFPAKFSVDSGNLDTQIETKLFSARHAFLRFAIEGLKKLLTNNGFPVSADHKRIMESYSAGNSSLAFFLQRSFEPVPRKEKTAFTLSAISFDVLYQQYCEYTHKSNLGVKCRPTILEELKAGLAVGFSDLLVEDSKTVTTIYGLKSVTTTQPNSTHPF